MQHEHPLRDDYWEEKHGNLAHAEVPLLAGASRSTQRRHDRNAIEGFRPAFSADKWLEIHGRKEWETYYGREPLETRKRFVDHFLAGAENDWPDTPRVRLEGRERFCRGLYRHEDDWPLARADWPVLRPRRSRHGADIPSSTSCA